jgi:hypothetical protein
MSLQAQIPSTAIENRFLQIENRLDASSARMDSIENLFRQLKGNTDIIAGQLHQLSADLHLQSQAQATPANKLVKLSQGFYHTTPNPAPSCLMCVYPPQLNVL